MSQALSHVFLHLRHNPFETKEKLVRMVNQIGSKVFRSSYQVAFDPNSIFFADVCCVIYRIRWENKHFDVIRTLTSVIQISYHSQRVVFQKCFSLSLQNNIFVAVFHAVISIQVVSIKFGLNHNWRRKVQKKSLVRNTSCQTLREE